MYHLENTLALKIHKQFNFTPDAAQPHYQVTHNFWNR